MASDDLVLSLSHCKWRCFSAAAALIGRRRRRSRRRDTGGRLKTRRAELKYEDCTGGCCPKDVSLSRLSSPENDGKEKDEDHSNWEHSKGEGAATPGRRRRKLPWNVNGCWRERRQQRELPQHSTKTATASSSALAVTAT